MKRYTCLKDMKIIDIMDALSYLGFSRTKTRRHNNNKVQ